MKKILLLELKQTYGFYFNNIEIKDNNFIKTPKNKYGKEKIANEINFYNFLIENKVPFPIPKIVSLKNKTIKMQFLLNYKPLTKLFYKNQKKYLKMIFMHLKKLHSFSKIKVSKKKYFSLLQEEVVTKNLKRFEKIKNNIPNNITRVNETTVQSYDFYVNELFKKINSLSKNKKNFYLAPTHGDTHLGNILIYKNDIRFIDPRGVFGNIKIYGIKEYDYAKLLFGISGYSIFDTLDIKKISVSNNNIQIKDIVKYENCYKQYKKLGFCELSMLLSLAIWLGNCSMFVDVNKQLTSYYLALYFCERYLNI